MYRFLPLLIFSAVIWSSVKNKQIFLPCSENEKLSIETGCKGLESGKKYIISDKGGKLARCPRCGYEFLGIHNDALSTSGSLGSSLAQWTFEPVGDRCIIKSDIEAYLGGCDHCWLSAMYNQSVFIHVSSKDAKNVPYSRWIVEKHGDKVAFKSDVWGFYMARCENCLGQGYLKSDFVFLHATSPEGPALWSVRCV